MYKGTKAVVNCCHNIQNGNIKLTRNQKRKLKKYTNEIKIMIDPEKSLKFKRNLINQNGGFLGALMSVVLPAVTGIVSSLINK